MKPFVFVVGNKLNYVILEIKETEKINLYLRYIYFLFRVNLFYRHSYIKVINLRVNAKLLIGF